MNEFAPVVIGLTVLLAYLIGAIPFGYLVARWRGVDIFKVGSGNIGATNVGRVLGRGFGILVFVLDFAKGALPSLGAGFAATLMQSDLPSGVGREELGVAAGLAAFLGHLFPIYLRFRGGKGVATGAGVVTVLLPGPALVALVTWITLVAVTRYVSLASIGAATALCVVRLAGTAEPFAEPHRLLTSFCLAAMLLVVLRHHANIGRLVQGNESRLKESTTMLTLTKVIHVLAMGLWFGTTVFFTLVVGLSLFDTFDKISEKPREDRPLWFPLTPEFDQPAPAANFPQPLRLEQGRRVAGAAVGPMFDPYFGIQGACAILALVTSLSWSGKPGRVHRVRKLILGAALLAVLGGWMLERKVSDLRVVRNDASDAVLKAPSLVTPELRQTAQSAREEFGKWHGYSLMGNFLTLLLVTAAMGMTALLPTGGSQPTSVPLEKEPAEKPQPAKIPALEV